MSHSNTHTTTAKYVWKRKHFFASQEEKLDEYFLQKKEQLFKQLNLQNQNEENQSLLALLPDPWSLKDIRKAAQRILLAIEQKEKITIFGDYDVDGTTSCAMLKEFFSALNYAVEIYIPDRLTEGYGLNPVGVKKLSQNGTKLIITVDNGIAALNACLEAQNCHIDVIITDHHDVPAELPQAFAILNPKQIDCLFPFKMLAGVGVAFYLMIALRALLREISPSYNNLILKNYLDYVAIGTIADMAPLNGANHILCKIGLEVLQMNLRQGKRLGLFELLKLAGWSENTQVCAADIGFKIGPRLNAAGRLGNALRSVD
ncbi:MAG: DHH family phosphoesterase, partial [Bdellovibrionota bacterium]